MFLPNFPIGGLVRSKNRGFTLVELMVVMAIIAALVSMAAPMVSGMAGRNQMNKNLMVLSGVFEQARQTAIARNTYVWVLISSPSASDGIDAPVKVGQFASTDGTDVLSWTTTETVLSGTDNLEIVGKPQELHWASLVNSSAQDAAPMADVNIKWGSPARTYTRAIQFTPTGEARVSTSVDRFIDVVVQSTVNSAVNQGVLRLAGLTGKTSVQRD